MKTSERFQNAFEYFKQNYAYKMGGTQTVILPNGKSKEFDDRQYYSGRGEKYNNSIKHDHLGDIKVSRKDYSQFLKKLKMREAARLERIKEDKALVERTENAKNSGVYTINKNGYVELSRNEIDQRSFDAERLAKTLDIKLSDAELLESIGKTYVFAKQNSSNKIYQLYHPSLDCNNLSIHVEEVSEERMREFNHQEWASAPYAKQLGQTAANNHFVC